MNDLKYAIRAFLRTPGFTLVAVLTLGLGIGATTAIFSVVNAVLLRPLPYASADRLVTTRGSLPDLRDLEAATQSFEGMAFWASNLYNLRTDADTSQVLGGMVTGSLLPLLGVQPVLGRNFTADDERQPTMILSDALWRTRFGGDPGVLGRSMDLGGTSYTVIGVAPAWFRFPSADFQLWTPLAPHRPAGAAAGGEPGIPDLQRCRTTEKRCHAPAGPVGIRRLSAPGWRTSSPPRTRASRSRSCRCTSGSSGMPGPS